MKMDSKQLNGSLVEIVSLRTELSYMSYSDEQYDVVEDRLHELEDTFVDTFGDALEDVIGDVLAQVKSDSDVLLPTSYLPQSLEDSGTNLEMDDEPGVTIDIDEYGNEMDIRLVLLPNPARLVLVLNGDIVKDLWSA